MIIYDAFNQEKKINITPRAAFTKVDKNNNKIIMLEGAKISATCWPMSLKVLSKKINIYIYIWPEFIILTLVEYKVQSMLCNNVPQSSAFLFFIYL
jgi:hypothetical protein